MGNILNHNRLPFETRLDESEYWDFSLYLYQDGGNTSWPRPWTGCLSVFIDTEIDECVTDSVLQSSAEYMYSKCISNGLELKNIGFTGTDNGLVKFDKYTITPDDFAKMLSDSVYTINEGDCTLKLNAVGGNNGIYSYVSRMVDLDGIRCAKLNGGFFQGVFAAGKDCEYTVLPKTLGSEGWSLDFTLRRKDFINTARTLNSEHPENKGMFFFMGTRAENKWLKYYDSKCSFPYSTIDSDPNPNPYIIHRSCDGDFGECLESEYYPNGYMQETDCGCINYLSEQYMEAGKDVDGSSITETNDGHQLDEANLTEIETENKFVLFDRSCDGLTVKTYEEGDTALIQYRVIDNDANYFTLFNRSCDGMTVKDYDEYLEKNGNSYDVMDDLYRNAFGLQIKDDGSVGYKYLIKDCESDNPECSYKVESEFTNVGEVPYDEWTNIHVRISRLSNSDKMRILIYVNGKLRLVSKELPVFDFRNLNDTPDKQEGVPYNISLGGGTQGLCDVIYSDYDKIPAHIYPLENEFGGTFIGYFKTFRFYECGLTLNQLRTNIYKV